MIRQRATFALSLAFVIGVVTGHFGLARSTRAAFDRRIATDEAAVTFPAGWLQPPADMMPDRTRAAARHADPPAITVFPSHDDVARDARLVRAMAEAGRLLFLARFNASDGAGRPSATGDSKPTVRRSRAAGEFIRTSGPDANSCSGCHNQPATGGSGDFAANVFVGAHFKDPPTTSIDLSVTSDRNTMGLFGSGAIEMVAREMTADLLAQRATALAAAARDATDVEIELYTKGVAFGTIVARSDGSYEASRLDGIDPDLVVKPFGVKGVAVSLREFSINALNQHHGIEAIERFGWARTGRRDFDDDGVDVELSPGQVSALVLFQALLPAPGRAEGTTISERAEIARGDQLFRAARCSTCHVPALPLSGDSFTEPNPYNRPGTAVPADLTPIRAPLPAGPRLGASTTPGGGLSVNAYTDLKRHRICDEAEPFFCNEQLRQDNVRIEQFMTPKLWDLATSAPYGHRGDCPTISEAIRHHSGEAADSRHLFQSMNGSDQRALIRFLLSLGRESQS